MSPRSARANSGPSKYALLIDFRRAPLCGRSPLLDRWTVFRHPCAMYENLRAQKSDILFPCKIQIFPDGYCIVTCADRAVFRSEPVEPSQSPDKCRNGENKATDVLRSARRARARVRELSHCAPVKYFVTLTLDARKVDRYEDRIIIRRFSQWADNQVRRKGLAYIVVPERHKDGAIHFHGLFTDALQTIDSGTLRVPGSAKPRKPRGPRQRQRWLDDGAQIVYNLPGWSYGFSTAIELYGDRARAIGYVCKYIGKQIECGMVGGRWYYHGGKFAEPRVEYYDITARDAEDIPGSWYTIEIPAAGLVMKRKEYWTHE